MCGLLVSLFPLRSSHGLTFPSVKELITMPNAESDLLIFFASSKVWPVAPVLPTYMSALAPRVRLDELTFSEPAKSTRYRFPLFWLPFSVFRWWIPMTNIECDRDDCSFISTISYRSRTNHSLLVAEVLRLALPACMTLYTSSSDPT